MATVYATEAQGCLHDAADCWRSGDGMLPTADADAVADDAVQRRAMQICASRCSEPNCCASLRATLMPAAMWMSTIDVDAALMRCDVQRAYVASKSFPARMSTKCLPGACADASGVR
jgi:hypothetical protein